MKTNKGFTLIELLVVIAIIGVLSSIVLVSMGGARTDARNTARKSDMRQIITAQEMYYGAEENYFKDAGPAVPDIGTYLDAPEEGKKLHAAYVWLGNDGVAPVCGSETAGEFFCAFATLEGDPVTYYAASEKGTKELAAMPTYTATVCECW